MPYELLRGAAEKLNHNTMKKFLEVSFYEEGTPIIESDFFLSEEEVKNFKVVRDSELYRSIMKALQKCGPNIFKAIRILDRARGDARFPDYEGLHPDLEEALISWRRKKAKEKNLPAYIILSQRALLKIADTVPSTMEELLEIPGVGETVSEHYGEEILDITSGCF